MISETSLYTYVPCFEFEKIDVKDCPSLEFRYCKTLMKSKKPLPKLIFSRLGSSIRDIVSLDGDFLFTLVDETQYRRNKKRQYKIKNEVYLYLGADNYLYIPDHEIHSVDLTIFTMDLENVDDISSCKEKDKCKDNWSLEFICPSKLIETTKEMALQKLGITRQLRNDENLNGQEGS